MFKKQKSLKHNAIMNLVNQVSAVLFPVITFSYVSRVLQPEMFGRVSFAQSVVSLFMVVAGLGIHVYGIREAARIRENDKALALLTLELFLLNLCLTVIVFTAFWIYMLCSQKASADPRLFWVCTIPMLLGPIGFGWLFEGLEEYTYITIRTIAFRFLVLFSVFMFLHSPDDYVIYALITGLNIAGTNIVNLFFVRKHISFRDLKLSTLRPLRHLRGILVFFSMSLATLLFASLDKTMLGYMSGDFEVGFYTISWRMTQLLAILPSSLLFVTLPRMSNYAENNPKEYNRILHLSIQVILLLVLPMVVGALFLAEPIIVIFFGSGYLPSVPLLQVMCFNILFISVSRILSFQIFYPFGKEHLAMYSVVIAAVLNFVLNILLIPYYGALGATVATLACEATIMFVRLIQVRGIISVRWPYRIIVRYFLYSTGIAVWLVLLQCFQLQPLTHLVLGTAGGAMFYLICLLSGNDSLVNTIRVRAIYLKAIAFISIRN